MLVQDYLKSGGTVLSLKERYGIDATFSEKYPELVLLKYNQIESPMSEPLVQECRGLVLDSRDWSIVAHPFHKFFNDSEPLAAKVDWATAKVYEKLDGSLCTMYWYDQWRVATSGNPDAAGNVNGFDMCFADLFWDTFLKLGLPTDRFNPDCTYMWELCTPFNKVVVQHAKSFVTLIGCRNRITGQEYDAAEAGAGLGVPYVRSFPMGSLEAVKYTAEGLKGFEQEGFVVVDGNFSRVKVKSPHYVMLHHMRDSMSPKGFVEVVRKGESEEFLAYFPEFSDVFNSIKLKFQMYCSACDADWYAVTDKYRNAPDTAPNLNFGELDFVLASTNYGALRKEFAEVAKTKKSPGYLFARLDGKVKNCAEYLAKQPIDNVMRVLELK